MQVDPAGQLPQFPPQPSGPQVLPLHCGTHAATHAPASHASLAEQPGPQDPPHPSGPHTTPPHLGMQRLAGHAGVVAPVGSVAA